jgi:pimeloyl-ACP methyl ester carboxylesterase
MTRLWSGFAIVVILLALAGIATIAITYFRALRLARKRLADLGSQVLETDCGAIEYVRVGQGYPVLVVHGAMGGFDHGLWLAHGFNVMDYQLICISRFGYLRSALPPGANLNLQADAFACLLDALGIQKVAVLAVSAGSTCAIRFTARHPERVSALVLLGPDSPGPEQMPMPPRFIYETILGSDFIYWVLCTFFRKQMQSTMGLAPKGFKLTAENEGLIKRFLGSALPVSERMDGLIYDSYPALIEFNESVSASSPYPLGRINTPVLVVHALDDPLAIARNVQALAGLLPNAQRYILPDGGHLYFGHMEEVTAKILQFMHAHLDEQKETADSGILAA